MILSKFTVFYQMPRWCAGKWNKFVAQLVLGGGVGGGGGGGGGAGGGGGGTQQMFIQGGSAPRSNPLPFHIPFFTKKVALLYSFYWQMIPLWHTLFRTLHLLTAVNAPSFK